MKSTRWGIKDLTICASSLGKAQNGIVPVLKTGRLPIFSLQVSAVKSVKPFQPGNLKGLAIMRSHGGRVKSNRVRETRIDIAFIGTPTCDDYGNCRGIGGKSDCGVLSYAIVDADHADKVVAITDMLKPYPNFLPISVRLRLTMWLW